MTAIASIYTTQGFVVGSDSLRSKRNGEELSVQKIFLFNHPALNGAHAWTNAEEISRSNQPPFRFSQHTQELLAAKANGVHKCLADLVAETADELYKRLLDYCPGGVIDPCVLSDTEVASAVFVAYLDNRPQRVNLVFPHHKGLLSNPYLKPTRPALDDFFLLAGSLRVWEDVKPPAPPASLADAIDLVTKYLNRCVEKRFDYDDCKTIGGDIHIAKVTPQKADWEFAPK